MGEYIREMFDKYGNSGNSYYKQVIQKLIILERYTYHDLRNYLLDELFLNIGSGILNDFKLKLVELFEENLFQKTDKKQMEVFKLKLKQFLDSEFFSCIDTQEVNDFKSRLNNFFEEQKLSDLIIE
ncbi:MAG: hypothetical protein ABIJ12_07975, partial [bacterium]